MSSEDRIAQDDPAVEPLMLDAADSAQVRAAVRLLTGQGYALVNAAEVFMPAAGCGHGCKVYARRYGAVVRYTLHHSRTYGCQLPARPVRLTAATTRRAA